MPRLFTGIEIPRRDRRPALVPPRRPPGRPLDRPRELPPDAPLRRRHRHGRRRRDRRRARPRPPQRASRSASTASARSARASRTPSSPASRRRRRSPSCRPSTSASCSGSGCRPSSGSTSRTSRSPACAAPPSARHRRLPVAPRRLRRRAVRGRSLRPVLVAELGRRRTVRVEEAYPLRPARSPNEGSVSYGSASYRDEQAEALAGLGGWHLTTGRMRSRRLHVRRFQRGLRLHGARRARRREDGPPPGLVERLQDRRGDALHPRRRRRDRARHQARQARWTGSPGNRTADHLHRRPEHTMFMVDVWLREVR